MEDSPTRPKAKRSAPRASDKLCAWLQETLGKRVESVRTGKRLVNSPAIALMPEGEIRPADAPDDPMKKDDELEAPEVILEINPRSALVKSLAAASERTPKSPRSSPSSCSTTPSSPPASSKTRSPWSRATC